MSVEIRVPDIGDFKDVPIIEVHVKAGDTASARRIYQDVFATWKDADAGLPLLVQAKAEYGALK